MLARGRCVYHRQMRNPFPIATELQSRYDRSMNQEPASGCPGITFMGAFWIRRGLFEHARRVVGLRGHVKNADLNLTGKAKKSFTSTSNLALAA